MTHHNSATRLHAGHRRIHTDETTALPMAHAADQSLTPGEHTTSAQVLPHKTANNLMEHGPAGKVRQTVLANADNPLQRQLETSLLLALGQAVLHRRPGPLRHGSGCSVVRSDGATGLRLSLGPSTLAPVLAELNLPRLRVVRRQRKVELVLGEGELTAAVCLSGITPRQWLAASAYAQALTGAVWPIEHGRPALAQNPSRGPEGRPIVAALCSTLLRRLEALGTTSWLTADVDEEMIVVRLTWAGGRTADEFLASLTHALQWIRTPRLSADRHDEGLIVVTLHLGVNLHAVEVVLHNLPADAPPTSRRLDTATAWAAFDHALTRPASPVSGASS